MNTKLFSEIFTRDLNRLKGEIEAYENEAAIWVVDKDITNSAGNLTLHLIGNLNTYIGQVLGKSDYIRNRDDEFRLKDVPRSTLVLMIQETIAVLESTLDKIAASELEREYPIVVFESRTTTGFMLVHLASHLGYHLGQINYHRRLLDQPTTLLGEKSATNRAIIEKLYQLFSEGALQRIEPLFQQDAVWIQMEGFPGGGTYTGRQAIIDGAFRKLKSEWEAWENHVDSFIEAGESVFVTGRYTGTHLVTSKSFSADFIHHYEFKEGKISRFKQYTDTAQIETAYERQAAS